jgi:FtsP/CotA-like multicopper oxidase with cupredoxin domain
MPQIIKKHGTKMFAVGFIAGLLVFAVMAFNVEHPRNDAPAREIVLITKDIAFLLASEPDQPNPPLHLKKGETVKLTLLNQEPGEVLHCFTLGGLGVKTSRHLATGEWETLTFTPRERGVFSYACLMHPMMAGKIVVE